MKNVLIVPCVTKVLNTIFDYDQSCCMINCVMAISNLRFSQFDNIFFVLYKEIDEKYKISQKINADIMRLGSIPNKIKIVTVDKMTSSPAETVYTVIETISSIYKNEDFSVFIKDADNMFHNSNVPYDNALFVASLEDMELVDPIHKSYVKLDEQGFVTNCIERRVISDKFIAGGYSFRSANIYKEAYDALKTNHEKFYISDIVFWLILNKNEKFLPVEAELFTDFNI